MQYVHQYKQINQGLYPEDRQRLHDYEIVCGENSAFPLPNLSLEPGPVDDWVE